jgi:hypothetical protein
MAVIIGTDRPGRPYVPRAALPGQLQLVPERLHTGGGDILIDGYILYKGFFVTELALAFKIGSSIVWFSLAWAVIGIGWAWWSSRRRSLASISLASEV